MLLVELFESAHIGHDCGMGIELNGLGGKEGMLSSQPRSLDKQSCLEFL